MPPYPALFADLQLFDGIVCVDEAVLMGFAQTGRIMF